jgi:hypothetical protein
LKRNWREDILTDHIKQTFLDGNTLAAIIRIAKAAELLMILRGTHDQIVVTMRQKRRTGTTVKLLSFQAIRHMIPWWHLAFWQQTS